MGGPACVPVWDVATMANADLLERDVVERLELIEALSASVAIRRRLPAAAVVEAAAAEQENDHEDEQDGVHGTLLEHPACHR